MVVRIRLNRGRPIRRVSGRNRDLALACGALLVPASLMAYVLGFWRLAADMGFAGQFGISGLFSHWQIWILAGVVLHFAASSLKRYGAGGDLHVTRLTVLPLLPSRPAKPSSAILRESKTGVR